MVDCFSLLLNMDILNAAVCPFVTINEFAVWFYALILFGIEFAIYLKTENLMIPSILGVFISGAFLAEAGSNILNLGLPPLFFQASTIIFAINFAIIIYGIYKGATS